MEDILSGLFKMEDILSGLEVNQKTSVEAILEDKDFNRDDKLTMLRYMHLTDGVFQQAKDYLSAKHKEEQKKIDFISMMDSKKQTIADLLLSNKDYKRLIKLVATQSERCKEAFLENLRQNELKTPKSGERNELSRRNDGPSRPVGSSRRNLPDRTSKDDGSTQNEEQKDLSNESKTQGASKKPDWETSEAKKNSEAILQRQGSGKSDGSANQKSGFVGRWVNGKYEKDYSSASEPDTADALKVEGFTKLIV